MELDVEKLVASIVQDITEAALAHEHSASPVDYAIGKSLRHLVAALEHSYNKVREEAALAQLSAECDARIWFYTNTVDQVRRSTSCRLPAGHKLPHRYEVA